MHDFFDLNCCNNLVSNSGSKNLLIKFLYFCESYQKCKSLFCIVSIRNVGFDEMVITKIAEQRMSLQS